MNNINYKPLKRNREGEEIINLYADGIKPWMIKRTESKYKKWDKVLENNILETGTKEEILEAYKLLEDVSIWAYAFLRVPGTQNPMKMRPYQDLILNHPSKRVMFVAANQCIYEKEKVYTTDGRYEQIKDLKVGQKVLSYKDGELVPRTINWKSEPVKKKCYKLKTRSGKELILSEDHPILTPKGYLSIKDGVHKNNYLETRKQKFHEITSMVCVPKETNNFNNKSLKREEIIILAYMMTDGSFGRDGQTPKFTNNSQLLLNEFETCVRYFVPSTKWYKKGNGYDIIASTGTTSTNVINKLKQFLIDLGIWVMKEDRRLPEIIWGLNKEQLALFINRIYAADGTVFSYNDKGNTKCRIMFYSPSYEFITDLKELLLKFGVHSNIVYDRPTKNNLATKIGYRLTCQNPIDILRFFKEFGLIYSKEEKSKEAIDICERDTKTQDIRDMYLNGDFFWDYITKIEHLGIKTCYDISVEETENFLVGGMIVHNCGKSYSLCIKGIHYALHNPGHTILMISKTLIQSKDLLRQIKLILSTSRLDYKSDLDDIDNKTEVWFKHYDKQGNRLPPSRIVCAPATEGVLGYAANLILADEIAFVDNNEDFYYRILRPRTYATKGQIILFSNPNGSTGLFHKLWKDDEFDKFRFTFLDNPDNTKEEYLQLCKSLTIAQKDSTLDAAFTSAEGGFFSVEEIRQMQEDRGNFIPLNLDKQLYVFYDFAKQSDNTIRMIGVLNDEGTGVYVYEIKKYPDKCPYNEIIDDLILDINEIGAEKFAIVGFDAGGPGKALEDYIKRIQEFGIQMMPVDFTLQKKNSMYTLLKLLAEKNIRGQQGIKMPFTEYGNYQLAALRFKTTARGLMTIHHENESDKDDVPDCLAGLCSLIIQPDVAPVTLTMIKPAKDQPSIGPSMFNDRCECGNVWEGEQYCTFCRKQMY